MLKNYIQNLLVGLLDEYVEDLTANDIQLDQWNGRIAKENVKLKATALDWIFHSTFGAPCEIVQGYIKKISVDVPYTQILSKPVELKIEEIHIIIKSKDHYDRDFVKQMLLATKKEQVNKILDELKKQAETKLTDSQQKDSYLGKIVKIIWENLRINIRNVHLRFEDTNVSRCDQAFNFGLIAESISYSMTNNRFTKTFLNIDDKIQEQKSYSLLLVTKFAVYWNSNAQVNWTNNKEFVNLTAQETIDFSKRHTDNLMRKHFTNKNEFNSSNTGVFLIQPCNWSIKFRTNLAPNIRVELPENTTVWESSEISLALDEEIYKDLQYLTKFFAWHANSVQKTGYLKYRPLYNQSVFGNAPAFWRYAIRATVYMLRKEKQAQSKILQQKRQSEMIQLAEIYKIEAINKFLKESGSKERILQIKQREFPNEACVAKVRKHIECKLTPEQIVVAFKQAEKESQIYIQEHQQKSGWRSWVPSVLKTSYWTGGNNVQNQPTDQVDELEIELQKQVDMLVKKSQLIEKNSIQSDSDNAKQMTSHFVFQVPLFQVFVVNKQDSAYNAKSFMSLVVQDFFYQSIVFRNSNTSQLFSIKSFEIYDKLLQSPKFQRIIYKKLMPQPSSIINRRALQKIQAESYNNNLNQEADEESSLFINNGLPVIRNFVDIINQSQESEKLFLLAQLSFTSSSQIETYRLDALVNPISLFYNRALIARIQTFMHQATFNKVQNATAEADFDQRVQALQSRTKNQVSDLLKKSEFSVNCSLKCIEIIIPDDTNFEQSKFVIIQTGSVVLRSKHDIYQQVPQKKSIDAYFLSQLDQAKNQMINSYMKQTDNREDFCLNLNEIQVFYLQQTQQLETMIYNEINKEDLEKLHSLLRKTDVQIQVSKWSAKANQNTSEIDFTDLSQDLVYGDVSFSNIEVKFTNKELKELYTFFDRFTHYHEELQEQVIKELAQIKFEAQIKNKNNKQKSSLQAQKVKLVKSVASQLSFQRMPSYKSFNGSDSNEDEFFDAQDYFDPKIIELIEQTKIKQINTESAQAESSKQSKTLIILLQIQISKLKLQIIEQNIFLSQDSILKQGKGIPFASFELSRATVNLLQQENHIQASFSLKDYCILNTEKLSSPQVISRSGNFDIGGLMGFTQRKDSIDLDSQLQVEQQQIFDLENEDNLEMGDQFFDDFNDYFIKAYFKNEIENGMLLNFELGLIELELCDSMLKRMIEVIITGWPQSVNRKNAKSISQKPIDEKSDVKQNIVADFEGFVIRMRVKKDISTLKLLGIKMCLDQKTKFDSQLEFSLDDLQLMHLNNEIVYKHNIIKEYKATDEHIPAEEDFHILNVEVRQQSQQDQTQLMFIRGNFSNMLIILESQSIVQIAQNCIQIYKTAKPIINSVQPQTNSNNIANVLVKDQVENIVQVEFNLEDNFFQLPVRENKNSLFLQIQDLILKFTNTNEVELTLKSFEAFVAKQIEQENRYRLFIFDGINITNTGLAMNVELNSFEFYINENFILFLAALTESHFDEAISLVQLIQQLNGTTNQTREPKTIQKQPEFVTDQTIDKLSTDSPFLQSIVATLRQNSRNVELQSYKRILIGKIEIFWITGMSFDDHEENYVTLHNRNQTKIILEQLSRKQTTLEVEKEYDYDPTFKENELLKQKSNISPAQNDKEYEKLVFRIQDIILETTNNQSYFSAFETKSITIENVNSKQVHSLFQVQHGQLSPAIQIVQAFDKIKATVHIVDITICHQHMNVISNIAKASYSCKNVISRGKKRKMFKNLFEEPTGKSKESATVQTQSSNDIQIKIRKFRIVCFENAQVPKKSKLAQQEQILSPGQVYIDTMTKKAIDNFINKEENVSHFKGNGLVVIEAGLSFQISQPSQEQQEEVDFENVLPADSQFKLKVTGLQVYLNAKHTSVADLLAGEKRLLILYPVDIHFEQQFYKNKNLCITDIQVSLIELELSFKQLFFLYMLGNKILDGLKPITQILESIQHSKRNKKNQEVQTNQKSSSLLTIQFASFYFALIRETTESSLQFDYQTETSVSSIPMLSLELKWLLIKQKTQMTGLQSTDIEFPFELYYFNQKLNFFEPAIERVLIKLYLENGGQQEKQIQRITVQDTLNLNFSVALYENVFLLIDNFKQEFSEYNKQTDLDRKDQVLGFNSKQSEETQIQQDILHTQPIFFSPSSYFIKNKTGELLMFMAGKKPAFTELQPNELLPLDFNKTIIEDQSDRLAAGEDLDNSVTSNRELFEGVPSSQIQPNSDAQTSLQSSTDSGEDSVSSSSDEHKYFTNMAIDFTRKGQDSRKPISPYRRGRFKFKKSEPNRVQLQVSIQRGKLMEKTLSFEINFDNLSCQRVYLDEQRQLYVICQMQIKDGQKHLIVRSPMQVTNNLQIPIEIQLLQTGEQKVSDHKIQLIEETKGERPSLFFQKQINDFKMLIKPGSSQIIPLKACSFDSVQVRPIIALINTQNQASSYKQDSQFEWSQISKIGLLQDETLIFEQKPVVCKSKISRNNRIIDRNNNQVFFVLNANTYSIRSYIDFNTQQTEFISLRYLSVTAPFTIQNLIPVPMTMLFKNIVREDEKDRQLYDMDLKHNSSLQVLYLNPLGNFDFSVTIPGFEQSNFIEFKLESDEDFQIAPDVLQKNYVESGFEQQNDDQQSLSKKAQWRFVKQKRLLVQLCSKFQSQFNICMNIAFVQGFYHVSFFAKYWFLNNTQMPLTAQVTKAATNFPSLELPYLNTDFDFETVKHFERHENNTDGKDSKKIESDMTRPRLGSGETIQTIETQTIVESKAEQNTGEINYEKLQNVLGINLGNITAGTSNYDASAQQRLLLMRLKPWETYKVQHSSVKAGLLAALNQEDIDRVSSIYFTQELIKEEQKEEPEAQAKPSRDFGSITNLNDFQTARGSELLLHTTREMEKSPSIHLQNLRDKSSEGQQRKHVQFDSQVQLTPLTQLRASNLNKAEKLTKISKSSIQVTNFTQQIEEQQAVPLNHTPLSKFDLFPAPLEDKDQLKRVILFSDVPTEEQQVQSLGGTGESADIFDQNDQQLKLKICNSEWCALPFDLAKLQQEPIQIKDGVKPRILGQSNQPQSMFEIVSVVSFLPQPFSFSKLICFQPRYLMVNRTCQIVTVVQAQCEDLGAFKIFPKETSVFHWTDASKLLEICVKIDDHEFSGNMRIDGIGEINLRLKNNQGQENIIINVSISEETNSLYIVFSDVSYAPPYRIENLTKAKFKVQQIQGRSDDFDRLNAFQTISFAWSYPLSKKLLRISLCHMQNEEDLGSYNIDSISKTERIILKDRQNKRQYVMEITNEKTVKVVRILYPQSVIIEEEKGQLQQSGKDSKLQVVKQKLIIRRLGFSVVNSQARELCYASFSNLRICNEVTQKQQKLSFKVGDIQIDNQLSRSSDAIIFKREQPQRAGGNFLSFKFLYVKNEAIENLLYYKYLFFDIVPFELNLDGHFCDETYKYVVDVFQLATKYALKMKQGEIVGTQKALQDLEFDPTAIKPLQTIESASNEVEQIKSAFNELKKKGQPLMETQRDVKKIYFELFQINEIRLSFTFSTSPILFREFTMNPTLKFLIVLLSNLKNVKLKFGKCHLINQNLLLSIFLAQLKRFYWHEVSNHTQIFKIVSSMGIFGNLSDTLQNITSAFKHLVYRPFDPDQNKFKAILFGSLVFMKETVTSVSGSVLSILGTFKQGMQFLVQQGFNSEDEQNHQMVMDRDLFEDDIEQAQRPINNHFSTPLTVIDTQNRIWLKILTREKQNYDVKKRILRKHKEVIESDSLLNNSRKKSSSQHYMYQVATMTAKGVFYIPKKIIQTSAGLINIILQDDDLPKSTQKIRPPRFVSFTMELEPYSKKKAFALEILNEINLNVIETETIQKLYTMSQNVVIITGKRVICVEEQNQRISNNLEDSLGVGSNGIVYKHWNVFFKDIFRVSVEIIDRESQVIPKEDLERILLNGNEQEMKIQFVLKVHFLSSDDNQSMKQLSNAKGKKGNNQYGADDCGLSMAGLRVGRRDITAKMKDFRVLRRIHRTMEQRLAPKLLK